MVYNISPESIKYSINLNKVTFAAIFYLLTIKQKRGYTFTHT